MDQTLKKADELQTKLRKAAEELEEFAATLQHSVLELHRLAAGLKEGASDTQMHIDTLREIADKLAEARKRKSIE